MGSSKRQTVGYRYRMGLHMGVCHAPVDAVTELQGGERTAWQGAVTQNAQIQINMPELFGGDDREGGLQGPVDIMMGGPDQGTNDYLAAMQGEMQPAYRGFLGLVYRNGLVSANNPYIKPWAVRVRRILKGWHNDDPWYPEKAEIPLASNADAPPSWIGDGFSVYYIGPRVHVTDPVEGFNEFTRAMADMYGLNYTPVGPGSEQLYFWRPNESGLIYSKREEDTEPNQQAVQRLIDRGWQPNQTALIRFWVLTGLHMCVYTVGATSSPPPAPEGYSWDEGISSPMSTTAGTVRLWYASSFLRRTGGMIYGMNGAHMIFQCVTDPDWGMGQPAAMIDQESFTAAADQLWDESFGLITKWNQQSSVEEFIQIICDTIGAVFSQDRRTGLFKLRLLRGGYDIDSLPVLGPHNARLVKYERPSLADTVNELTVRYRDALTGKDASVPPVHNMANIQGQGRIVSQSIRYDMIATFGLAARVAERDLLARSTPLWRIGLEVDRAGNDLEPGAPVRVVWPAPLNIDVVVLPGEIDYGRSDQGKILVNAVEDVITLPAVAAVTEQENLWQPPDMTAQPAPVEKVFEVPYRDLARALPASELSALPEDAGFVAAAAARPPGVSVNFELRTAAAGDLEVAGTGDFTPRAALEDDIGPAELTVAVTGSEFKEEHIGRAAMIGNGRDAEIVRIDAVAPGELTLGRGCGDTVPHSWPAGSAVLLYEDLAAFDPQQYVDGETVQAKVLPRTPSGSLSPDAATMREVEMSSRQSRPYPPARLRINGAAYPEEASGEVAVGWAHRDRGLQQDQLVDSEEVSIGPESAVTYNVRFLLEDVLVSQQLGVDSDAAAPFTPESPGTLTVEVESERDGLTSWQKLRHSLVYGAVEPVSWTMAALGQQLAFWINDASDLEADGSDVLSVSDRSPRQLHASSPGPGAGPTVVEDELNGRRVLAFSGSQYLNLPSEAGSVFRFVPAGWFAAVYNLGPADTGNEERPILSFNIGTGAGFRAAIVASQGNGTNQPGCGGRRLDGDSYAGAMSSTPRAEQWVIVVGELDYQGRTARLWVNGSLDTEVTGAWGAAGNSSNTESSAPRLGANSAAGSPTNLFRGAVAEVSAGIGALSAVDVDRIFGYLAAHWGLQAVLPSGHPYKAAAPTYIPAPVQAGFPALLAATPRMCINHRGSAYLYPEHTNVAYAECVASGEPVIEQDLYLTAEGSAVCTHDATATYTTTSTASFSSLTDAQVGDLVVDSESWHGASFSGLKVPLYRDVIDAHIANAVFVSEGKTSAALAQAVVELDDASVPLGQVLLCSYDASNPATAATALAPAVSAGRPALLSSATADATAQALGAGIGYVGYRKDVSPGFISRSLANGLGVVAFTVNRRFEARQLFRRGVQGLFTDDPVYLRSEGPLATSDNFATGQWMSGMVAGADDSARPPLAARGRMLAPDAWGWTETADNQQGCLQGWACPVKGDDYADDFTIDFKLTFDSTPGNAARWIGCFIADGSELDRAYPFLPGSSSPAISGYLLLVRKNGTLDVFRRTGQTDVSIASQSGSTIATGVEVRFRVVVTPSAIAIQRLTSGGSVDYQASAADTTFRGGYFHLGKYGVACRFREITVS